MVNTVIWILIERFFKFYKFGVSDILNSRN